MCCGCCANATAHVLQQTKQQYFDLSCDFIGFAGIIRWWLMQRAYQMS
jgi:hypothetical protein